MKRNALSTDKYLWWSTPFPGDGFTKSDHGASNTPLPGNEPGTQTVIVRQLGNIYATAAQ